jgi:hypothetical protein
MLGYVGTKGGTILYHVGYGGYGATLGCHVISGVTKYCQPMCWLTSVGWVTKPNCDRICGMGILTCITSVFVMVGGREVLNSPLNNHFNLSFTKGKFLN